MNLALLQIIPHFTETQRLDLPTFDDGTDEFSPAQGNKTHGTEDIHCDCLSRWPRICVIHDLVGGLEHEFDDFPIYWECHHPNWRTHIFQRGRYTTNQWYLDMTNTASGLQDVEPPKKAHWNSRIRFDWIPGAQQILIVEPQILVKWQYFHNFPLKLQVLVGRIMLLSFSMSVA